MFLIRKKSTDTSYHWGNSKNDDFLQFVPKQLGTTKDNLDVYWHEQDGEMHCYECCIQAGNRMGHMPDYDNQVLRYIEITAGFMKGERDPETEQIYTENTPDFAYTEHASTPLKKLLQWPYDEEGKFLGNSFEA